MCVGVCECVCVCSVAQLCPTLCDSMGCSRPGSSVHGISQARILEWVDISFSRDQIRVSCITGRFFTPESPGMPQRVGRGWLAREGIEEEQSRPKGLPAPGPGVRLSVETEIG